MQCIRLSVFAQFLSALLFAACGGPLGATPCDPSIASCNPESEPDCGDCGAVVGGNYTLAVELVNTAGAERACQVTYTYTDSTGTSQTVTPVAASIVGSGSSATSSVTAQDGTGINLIIGCWDPGSPSFSGTRSYLDATLPARNADMGCRAVHVEDGSGASVSLTCD